MDVVKEIGVKFTGDVERAVSAVDRLIDKLHQLGRVSSDPSLRVEGIAKATDKVEEFGRAWERTAAGVLVSARATGQAAESAGNEISDAYEKAGDSASKGADKITDANGRIIRSFLELKASSAAMRFLSFGGLGALGIAAAGSAVGGLGTGLLAGVVGLTGAFLGLAGAALSAYEGIRLALHHPIPGHTPITFLGATLPNSMFAGGPNLAKIRSEWDSFAVGIAKDLRSMGIALVNDFAGPAQKLLPQVASDVGRFLDKIQPVIEHLAPKLTSFLGQFLGFVSRMATAFTPQIGRIFTDFLPTLFGTFERLIPLAKFFDNQLGATVEHLLKTFSSLVSLPVGRAAIGGFFAIINQLLTMLQGLARASGGSGIQIFHELVAVVAQLAPALVKLAASVVPLIGPLLRLFNAALLAPVVAILNAMAAALTAVTPLLVSLLNTVSKFLEGHSAPSQLLSFALLIAPIVIFRMAGLRAEAAGLLFILGGILRIIPGLSGLGRGLFGMGGKVLGIGSGAAAAGEGAAAGAAVGAEAGLGSRILAVTIMGTSLVEMTNIAALAYLIGAQSDTAFRPPVSKTPVTGASGGEASGAASRSQIQSYFDNVSKTLSSTQALMVTAQRFNTTVDAIRRSLGFYVQSMLHSSAAQTAWNHIMSDAPGVTSAQTKVIGPLVDKIYTLGGNISRATQTTVGMLLAFGRTGAAADLLKDKVEALRTKIEALHDKTVNIRVQDTGALSAIAILQRALNAVHGHTVMFNAVHSGAVKIATGGLVTSPTNAIVGDSPNEAVLPLEDPRTVTLLAKALAAAGVGGSGDVHVYIDGHEVMRAITRRQGLRGRSLPY